MNRKHLNRKGSAAVEFALVLPVLLLLVFGIVDFSIALYNKAVITNASREGARAGIVFQDPRMTEGEISIFVGDIVSTYCQDRLIPRLPVTSEVDCEGDCVSGDDLRVMVRYQYPLLALPGITAEFFGGGALAIPLDAQTIMRME